MQIKNIAIVIKNQNIDKYIINRLNEYIINFKIATTLFYITDLNFTQNLQTFLETTTINLVIVVGGDGTILSVAPFIIDKSIPLLGINQGKLGFMTDVVISKMIETIKNVICDKKYIIEKRSVLQAKLYQEDKIIDIALNDIVIARGAIGNMIEFNININDTLILSQKSDGIIFSTPTGSTAYALSAGGPIIHPHSQVIAIVPICPQALTNRPIIISDDTVIIFTLACSNETQINFDGNRQFNLKSKDKLEISKYKNYINILHPIEYNYYKTLQSKLNWSQRIS